MAVWAPGPEHVHHHHLAPESGVVLCHHPPLQVGKGKTERGGIRPGHLGGGPEVGAAAAPDCPEGGLAPEPSVERPTEGVPRELPGEQVDERAVEVAERERPPARPAPEGAVVPRGGEHGARHALRRIGDQKNARGLPTRLPKPGVPLAGQGLGRGLHRPSAGGRAEGNRARTAVADIRVGADQGIPAPDGADGGGVVRHLEQDRVPDHPNGRKVLAGVAIAEPAAEARRTRVHLDAKAERSAG